MTESTIPEPRARKRITVDLPLRSVAIVTGVIAVLALVLGSPCATPRSG